MTKLWHTLDNNFFCEIDELENNMTSYNLIFNSGTKPETSIKEVFD